MEVTPKSFTEAMRKFFKQNYQEMGIAMVTAIQEAGGKYALRRLEAEDRQAIKKDTTEAKDILKKGSFHTPAIAELRPSWSRARQRRRDAQSTRRCGKLSAEKQTRAVTVSAQFAGCNLGQSAP